MSSSNNAVVIRKLRKKLRQIENLSRNDRELSEDEQRKVSLYFMLFGWDILVLGTGSSNAQFALRTTFSFSFHKMRFHVSSKRRRVL